VTATASLDVSVLQLVAHEMRAPLAVLKGYLSMLREDSPGGWPAEEAMPAMEAKVEELEGLAQILVTAARLESAEMPVQLTVFDVAEAVAAAVERAGARARLELAEIEVFPAEGPLWVTADGEHVTRILTNLLNNALTYSSPPALVAVEVRAGSPVEVAVLDGGVGIAPERQERVFERFSRFAEGGANRAPGLGLGLWISRELAVRNGGELCLERSAPGEGSVFVLRLPLSGS